MIAYEGVRTSSGARVFRVNGDEREPLRQRIVYHSPTGFEWGYAGSGPSDLALNILADVSGWNGPWEKDRLFAVDKCATCGVPIWQDSDDDPWIHDVEEKLLTDHEPHPAPVQPEWVLGLHQAFKFDVIASADRQGFRLDEDVILSWLKAHGIEVTAVA